MSARIRTGYSFRHAAGKIEDVLKLLQHFKYSRAPITDTASTYGWVKWSAQARALGMDPVFGVELAVSSDITAKKPIVDYWTFLSRDSVVPLHGLIGVATGQFRYEPLLTIDQAVSAASVVNVIMGHRAPVGTLQARPGLWFGAGPGVVRPQLALALEQRHPPVAVCNNRFPFERDRALYELVCGRRAMSQSYEQHILSDYDLERCLRDHDLDLDLPYEAIDNRNIVLEQAIAVLPHATMLKPDRSQGSLRQICLLGAEKLGLSLNDTYTTRLNRELELIASKGFEDYFYLVADLVSWARERMLVGPARGSSCGSLVCYLLGITTVDPIPYGLLFERFIDVNRPDLPDIDIDFSDQHRELVFDYLRQKYGANKVARLGTVNMYQPRSALKELAIALDIPVWATDALADQAEQTSLKEALEGSMLARSYPELKHNALRMEDHPRHAGQHAAGIVITAGDVADVVAVDRRTGATMCDYRDAETLNLLKIDALGLTQLSIFEDALELAGLPRDALSKVSFFDQKALHILNARRFAGIFQFNGPALQNLCTKTTINSFDDMVAMTALARPGPLDSGEAQRWVGIRTGKAKPTWPHPLFEPILKPTLGIVIYQEQVMQICRSVGMSWEEVSALRRLISKSAGPEAMEKYFESFVRNGITAGIPEQTLNDVWSVLKASGAYSFNKSHAVAYSVISFWCCWLKAHHPLEFAAATLTHAGDDMQLKLLRELAREGTRYLPADAKLSTDKWTVATIDDRKALIGPLSNIIGIGPQHQRTILSARVRPNERLPANIGKILHRMKTKVDDLWPIQTAISGLMTEQLKQDLVSKRTDIIDIQPNGQSFTVRVEGLIDSLKQISENSPERIQRRQGRKAGGDHALNLWIRDDTDKIFVKVDWSLFEEMGKEIIDRGKGYYSIRGTVPADFRMIRLEKFRFIGSGVADDAKDLAAD